LLVLAAAFFLAGCKEADDVEHYRVQRVERGTTAMSFPDYQPAKDWKKKDRGRTKFARFRETFEAGKAEVSVSVFGRGLGTLLQNVNRYRKEVKVPESDELPKDLKKFRVAGTDTDYVDLQGPTSRVLAVMFEHDDYTFVFKMTGPSEEVRRQQQAFDDFLRSVSFADDSGPAR
jgi:hypothetical protein